MTAVRLMDGREAEVLPPDTWMLELVPEGQYLVMDGGHPLVLYPLADTGGEDTDEGRDDPPDAGKLYLRYKIGDELYSGCFVGKAV